MRASEIAIELEQLRRQADLLVRRLDTLRLAVTEEFDFPEWAQELVDARKCLVCGQDIGDDERVLRGCHERCRKQIERAIVAGQFTDAQAVALGKLAPKKSPGRPPKDYQLDEEEARKVAELSERFNNKGKKK